MDGLSRRTCLKGLLLASLSPAAWAKSTPFWQRVEQGACVVLMRHAMTDPGLGDPPGFQLNQCHTQRNLSAQGRSQSRQVGQAFASRGLQAEQVLSSAWCRCVDTAQLAFGAHRVWSPLNSFFGQGSGGEAVQQALDRIRRTPPTTFEVWVTHQVNITGMTTEVPAMGELFVCDARVHHNRLPVVARWSPDER